MTDLKISSGVRLEWSKELDVAYQKNTLSQINVMIFLKYGGIKATITWRSISGRIYEMDDATINCSDIQFAFKDLDIEGCKKLVFPVWSLITFKEIEIEAFKRYYNLVISRPFLECADTQLSIKFEVMTGIKINQQIALNLIKTPYDQEFEDALTTGTFLSVLYINNHWNPITIHWRSQSGRTYHISDEAIDCNDIVFHFVQLDPLLYTRQLYPADTIPFKIKELSFALEILRLNMECTLLVKLKQAYVAKVEEVITLLHDFAATYNEASEKKRRMYGVVHSSRAIVDPIGIIHFELDLGSAGISFLNKLLQHLSKLAYFDKVTIE